MSILARVNSNLERMHKAGIGGDKGRYGEAAVFEILSEFIKTNAGAVYWSLRLPAYENYPGNLKRVGDKFERFGLPAGTEIDALLITEFRVFVIEVKAYKSKKITLTDDAIAGSMNTEKSPVHQNEMHCRHLYPQLLHLPDGDPRYIIPYVVFVDEAVIHDNRSDWQLDYIKVGILNILHSDIVRYNTPLNYRLDIKALDEQIMKTLGGCEKRVVNLQQKGEANANNRY